MATKGNLPVEAYVLVLIGGILMLLGGAAFAILGAVVFSLVSLAGVGSLIGIIGIISGIIVILSALMMKSKDAQRVRLWSAIALIFSIVSIANGGGFVIGFILGLVGSVMGLAYKGK
jgi:hypothetical protein